MLAVVSFFGSDAVGQDLKTSVVELGKRIMVSLPSGAVVGLTIRETGLPEGKAEAQRVITMLETELRKARVRVARTPDAATLTIRVGLSEGLQGRLLIAELPAETAPDAIILPLTASSSATRSLRPVSLRQSLLWRQSEPILDVVLDSGRLWVLSPSSLALYEGQSGAWKEKTRWALDAATGFRDPRGRLDTIGDSPIVLLPGWECAPAGGAEARLACHPTDRGWPINRSDRRAAMFPKSGRNYFERLQTDAGVATGAPPFFSAAFVPGGEAGGAWALACLDGVTRILDASFRPKTTVADWGSDLAGFDSESGCAPGLIAVLSRDDGRDALQAFRLSGSRLEPASEALDLDGAVSALWAETSTRAALVVKEKNAYAASLLDISCAD
jgi:hypothetical protein